MGHDVASLFFGVSLDAVRRGAFRSHQRVMCHLSKSSAEGAFFDHRRACPRSEEGRGNLRGSELGGGVRRAGAGVRGWEEWKKGHAVVEPRQVELVGVIRSADVVRPRGAFFFDRHSSRGAACRQLDVVIVCDSGAPASSILEEHGGPARPARPIPRPSSSLPSGDLGGEAR